MTPLWSEVIVIVVMGWLAGVAVMVACLVEVIVIVAMLVPTVETKVLIEVTGTGVGLGTKVIVLGTPVQIPGFCGTKLAQMPVR